MMERTRRCSAILAVVVHVGFLSVAHCRNHHSKQKSESMPWFPAKFTTPPDQSAFLLAHHGHHRDAKFRNSTKGLHKDQTIGVISSHLTTIQATYGPFIVAENITPPTNYSNLNEINQFSVKPELLTTVLPIHDPTVRVMFRWEKKVYFSNGAAAETTGQEPLPCAKLVVSYGGQELASACRMQGGVLACVAKQPIPSDWWRTMGETDSIKTFYSVFQVAENAPCLPDNHNTIPPRGEEPATASPEHYIGEVKLGSLDDGFSINDEDSYVWIHSPARQFGSGAKFQVPVSVLNNFTATGCVIRAKARQGLQVLAVHTVDSGEWSISSRVNPKGSMAMVTMIRRVESTASYDGYTSAVENAGPIRSNGISIAFTVEFEVLNGTDGSRPINWRIDYEEEMHTMHVRTTVEMRPRTTHSLLAIIEDDNIINTAVLNGVRVNKPMRVLAASYAGQVSEVTGHAVCRSTDTTVVQVQKDCRQVYVDGTETSGSLSVQIQVAHEGQTTYVFLSIWMPEVPVDVVLDDDELSMIKKWKVPSKSSHRVTRAPDEPDATEEKKVRGKCRLRYQQSGVEVYTRFYAPHANTVPGQTDKKVYLFGGDVKHRITDLLVDQIDTEDPAIAVVRNGQVYTDGKNIGETNVKVNAPYGIQSLGHTSVTVSTDKVSVEELHVAMVTGMSMKIHPIQSDRSNIFVAKVKSHDEILMQKQEILLDGYMTFSDGSYANLQDVRHRDFTSVITTLYPEILSESPHSTSRHPTLIANGEGITSVLLEVKIPDACQKWKNNNVVVFDTMQINVSFAGSDHLPSSEGDSEPKQNGRFSLTPEVGPVDFGLTLPGYSLLDQDQQEGGGGKGRGGKKDVISSIPIDIDINDLYPWDVNQKGDNMGEGIDYNSHHLDFNFFNKTEEKLTPLEIGMYVLLGVFCLAILAFMINCILFMARYRKSKRVPGVRTSTYPQNWVLFSPNDYTPTPLASPEEMVPLQNCPTEMIGMPDECQCTESEISVERHSNGDCGMHSSQGQSSDGTMPCNARIYTDDMCDCCQGVCECEMDTALQEVKSEDEVEQEEEEEEYDRGSVSICSSESRENMQLQNTPAADCCNSDNDEQEHVDVHTTDLSNDYDSNAAVESSVAIAPEEPSTSTEATEDLEDPSSELRITLNPTPGDEEDCSLASPQDEIGFSELLDYLSELQESCA